MGGRKENHRILFPWRRGSGSRVNLKSDAEKERGAGGQGETHIDQSPEASFQFCSKPERKGWKKNFFLMETGGRNYLPRRIGAEGGGKDNCRRDGLGR